MEMPRREVDRITDLSNKIEKLNEDIKQYDEKIEKEEDKQNRDAASFKRVEEWRARIAGWEETIKDWRRDKAALRAALEAENAERKLRGLTLEHLGEKIEESRLRHSVRR